MNTCHNCEFNENILTSCAWMVDLLTLSIESLKPSRNMDNHKCGGYIFNSNFDSGNLAKIELVKLHPGKFFFSCRFSLCFVAYPLFEVTDS